jgi:hypothetical protein
LVVDSCTTNSWLPSSSMFPEAYECQSAPNPVTPAGNLPRFPCFPAPVPVSSLPRFPVGCRARTLGFTLAHLGHSGNGTMTALRQSDNAVTEQRRNAAKKVVDAVRAFWHYSTHGYETQQNHYRYRQPKGRHCENDDRRRIWCLDGQGRAAHASCRYGPAGESDQCVWSVGCPGTAPCVDVRSDGAARG